jgi:hypothetical protein
MLDDLDQIPAAAAASLLRYLNDPARSVAEFDRAFGPILGERLARAIIGGAPFKSLVDLRDRVSGIGDQKVTAMAAAQLEGRTLLASAKPAPPQQTHDSANATAPTFAGFGPPGGAGTGGTCFAPGAGGACFATTGIPPQPNSGRSGSTDTSPPTRQREDMAGTTLHAPSFEDAYRARLAQIQSYWKAIDVESIDLSMMHPAAVAGCLGTAGTMGTMGTSGGCVGTFGTLMTFGSAGMAMDPRIAAVGTPYAMMSPFAPTGPTTLAGTAGTVGTAGTAGCVGGTIGSMATIGTRGCWG